MNKQTLLFVALMTVTLFLVNTFFESRNQDTLRQWNEQQETLRVKKAKDLAEEIKSRTASPADLPIAEMFSDADGTKPVAMGVIVKNSLLTLSWDKEVPKELYAKKLGSVEKPAKFVLKFESPGEHQPLLYQIEGSQELMPIGVLPEYGKYDLQLISFFPPPTEIILGEYTDNQFSLPVDQLMQLRNEDRTQGKTRQNAIVLMKTAEGYQPVAVYEPSLEEPLVLLATIPNLKSLTTKPEAKTAITTAQKSQERFFVLENSYQQLVFSNYGGALLEINLPFTSKEDKESVVKEIEFDREMVADHPYNAYFPAHPYNTPGENPQGPFQENAQGHLGGYYPLLRRDLIAKDKRRSVRIPPRLYALNIVSEYPELAELVYEVKQFDKNTITFEATQSHRRITKTYSIASEDKGGPYCIDLTIKIEGDSRGLWLTSGVTEVEWISNAPAPSLKYRITRNNKPYVEQIDLPKDSTTVSSINPDWLSNSNGFFGVILDPLTEINAGLKVETVSGSVAPSRLLEIDPGQDRFNPQNLPGYLTMLPLKNNGGTMNFRIFAGPYSESILNTVDQTYSDPTIGYNPDYIACQSFHGWFAFISEPFAKFLFILMKFFYTLTGSWAISIILLTVALRVMLYPLNAWSTKSMVRMQQIAPEVTAIQEKYKKDPKKAQLEIMNLYRDKGVNPLSGCFPLLIQMPFLIGMFDLLKSTFELRGASFIPGWIDNLASPDVLFSWSTPIFFIGTQFHLLPILLGVVMFFQQRFMSTAPSDPKLMTEQQRQQRTMGTVMTFVFAIMFYHFPSGLNIYWLSSMLLGMLQQWWTQKRMQAQKNKAIVKG